jgi:hypothetical protein
MAQAKRDDNRVPTLIGVSSADLATPTLVAVDPSTNELLTQTTLVDADGEAATVTDGKLDVNASIDTTGLSTLVEQQTQTTHLSQIEAALETAGGLVVDLGDNNDVSVSAVVPGSAATNLGKADNGAFAGGDIGVAMLGVYNTLSVTNAFGLHAANDYVPFSIDAGANLRIALYTGNTELANATSGADGKSNTSKDLVVDNRGYYFNETGWDRMRGDLTDGLLVNLGTNNDVTLATLPDTAAGNLAAIDTDTGNMATSLGNLDNAVDGNYLNINCNIAGTDIVGGAGAVAAGVQRVTLASDDPAVVSLGTLDNAISGSEMQVDVVAALPAGTNAIGKLAANSGVDIGDVDVTSIIPNQSDLATLATTHVKKYYTSAGAATDGIIWSPAAGKRWYVTDIFIQVSAAATVTLEDDLAAGDSAIWKAELAANSGWSHSFTTPWFSGEDAADLIITTSAGNVYVTVCGYEI